LEEVIDTAINDNTFRRDDLEFTFAARVSIHPLFSLSIIISPESCSSSFFHQDWSERVSFGNMDGYREKFEKIQSYFAPRFPEATRVGNEMIKTIEESLRQRKIDPTK
jgi:prephenate dehydrogenase (NADP+)